MDRHGPDQKIDVLTICNHLYLDNFFMIFNIIQCWMIVVRWSLYRTRTNNIILDDSDLVIHFWIAGTSHVNLSTTKMVFLGSQFIIYWFAPILAGDSCDLPLLDDSVGHPKLDKYCMFLFYKKK